jgi:DNA-binding NarL/FixJ family response regulator
MRVLIVDDHEVVRQGVRSLLLNQPDCDVCGEAVDGQDAIEKAQQLEPDVIIMDVSMPNLNGLEATRRVRDILPRCEVLILSQHESPEMVRQAFNAGARGYVVKSSVARDLLVALNKLNQGEPFFDSAVGEVHKQSNHMTLKRFCSEVRHSNRLFVRARNSTGRHSSKRL